MKKKKPMTEAEFREAFRLFKQDMQPFIDAEEALIRKLNEENKDKPVRQYGTGLIIEDVIPRGPL